MENKEAYINLSKSLDSLRDVVMAEIRLIEFEGKPTSKAEQKKFSDFVVKRVKGLLGEIADQQQKMWLDVNKAKGEKLIDHGKELKKMWLDASKLKNHPQKLSSAKAFSNCPPGFVEVNGICVPI